MNENKENVLKKWKKIKDISIDSLKQTLKILNHDFDLWMGESDVNHLIPKMINKLSTKEITDILSQSTNVSKKEIYNYCLELKKWKIKY